MAADGSGSGFTKVTPVYTKPGSPVPVPFSVTGDVPPPAPLPLTGDETFTVYVDDIPMFTTIADALDTGVSSFNGRGGAVVLTTADITGAGGAPIDSPQFTGDPQAPTPTTGDNSNSIATTEFVTTAVDATFQDFLPLTGGTLAGPGNLTVGGILSVTGNTVTSGIITNNAGYYIASAGPGAFKGLELDTGNLQRWTIFSDNTAEGGANVGSNFQLSAYSDAGALLNTPISIQRSTGVVTLNTGVVIGGGLSVTNLANFTSTINVPTAAPGTSSTLAASTAFVTNAINSIPQGGVTSFNGRQGAITLTTADITGAGGATTAQLGNYLPLTGGTLSGPGNLSVGGTLGVTGNITGDNITAAGNVYSGDFFVSNVSAAGYNQGMFIQVGGNARWLVGTDASPESGGNAGSNIAFFAYSDTGAGLGMPLVINRATGVASFASIPTSPTPAPGDDSTNIATTAFVTAAVAAGGGGGGGTGTVTSVAFAATPNTVFGVIGSPITASGTINLVLNGQPQNSILAAPSGGGGIPNFRLLVPADLPNLSGTYLPLTGGAITGPVTAPTPTAGDNSTNVATTEFVDAAITAITPPGGMGTVTSVNLTAPNIFQITGVPITTSGTIAITNRAQNANTIFAGPASGGAAGATFRLPVASDFTAWGVATTAALGNYLPLTGGTLTGQLLINTTGVALNIAPASSNASIVLNKSADTNVNQITGSSAGTPRWRMALGTNEAETGSNAGSNFALYGYGDSGVQFSTPLFGITRATQAASFFGTVTALDFIISGTKPANMVWAGPASGPAAAPTWRALTAADIPGGGGGGGIPEAPTDGQIYGREGSNTSWQPVLPLTGGTLTGPGNLTVNGTLTGAGNVNAQNFVVNVAAPNATGYGINWDTSGTWRDYTANNDRVFAAPNGSCYMDVNGNFISNAALIATSYVQSYGYINASTYITAGGSITAGTPTATGNFVSDGQNGSGHGMQLWVAGNPRWYLGLDGGTETGGNTGSGFQIVCYNDADTTSITPLSINRATGNATFSGAVSVGNNLYVSTGTILPNPTYGIDWDNGNGWTQTFDVANGAYQWNRPGVGTLMTISAAGDVNALHNVYANGGNLIANSPAGTYRGLQIYSSNTIRWWIACDTSAESGGNAGSNLFIANYADNGDNLDSPFQMNRATGNALFTHQLQANGDIISEGNFHTPNSAYVGNALYWGNATWYDYVGGNATRYMIAPSGDCYMDVNGNFVSSSSLYATDYVYANNGWFLASGPTGQSRGMQIQTNSSPRWLIIGDTSAETGSNTGTNFAISAYSDAGAAINSYLTINRSNGQAVFAGSLITNTNFSAGSNITAGGVAYVNGGAVYISSVVQSTRGVMLQTSGSNRWFIYTNATNETGSNAGSDFAIASYSDAGANIAVPLTINRASGNATFSGAVTARTLNTTAAYTSGDQGHNGFGIVIDGTAANGAFMSLNAPSGTSCGIASSKVGVRRWVLFLGDGTTESGGNVGSNITLQNFDDSGNVIANVLNIDRHSGQANFGYTPTASNYPPQGGAFFVVGYWSGGSWYNAERAGVAVGGGTGVFFYNSGANYTQWSTVVSDRRRKSNIKLAGDALSFVKRLAVYDLDFKPHGGCAGEGSAEPPIEHWPFSLIADEVGEALPHAAMHGPDDDKDKWVGLHPQHLVATLWRAVQQLSDKVESLEARLAAVGG